MAMSCCWRLANIQKLDNYLSANSTEFILEKQHHFSSWNNSIQHQTTGNPYSDSRDLLDHLPRSSMSVVQSLHTVISVVL